MARYAKDNRPRLKPVEKVQLSEEHTLRRAIAAALFLLVGAAALVYALVHVLTPEGGWQIIQAGTSDGATCGDDFTLLYELGAGDQAVAAESRGLTRLYTQACRTAYQMFNAYEGADGMVNLWEIGQHPNEPLQVDAALYHVLENVQSYGDRTVYLGPVFARYRDVFQCQDDSQLADFDPRLSREVADEYAALAAYAMDPGQIDIELLEDFKVCLRMSEEYLAYARENGIDRFLDFGWLTNAFVADYVGNELLQAGFTHGVLASFDGFIYCMDDRDLSYTLVLYDEADAHPVQAGTMEYQGRMCMASLRTFPAVAGDERRFYRLRNGETRTLYLDPADGLCKGAVGSMTCYSPVLGCADLAMRAAPMFIAEDLNWDAVRKLTEGGFGVETVLLQDGRIMATDPALTLTHLRDGYTLMPVGQ